jgi:glutathione S-transferase
MTERTLIIGNKNYSSWSLRPWLALRQAGIDFTEVKLSLGASPEIKAELRRNSPTGRVPVLMDGDLMIWESLSICEYVAECFPEANLWPKDRHARAHARSISNEMHAGFADLRQAMPMDIRSRYPWKEATLAVQADIDRIIDIWQHCRQHYGKDGDFLFGPFTIADAMFAPVVTRFVTYDVPLEPICRAYAEAILALPAMQSWIEAAGEETEQVTPGLQGPV